MKNTIQTLVLGTLLASSIAFAQTTSETTTSTTTSDGTVTSYTPNVITVRSTSSTSPVNYTYSKTTTYVDENGNPVSMETVKSGAPVTVYYTTSGSDMVASKVVVRKSTMSDPNTVTEKKTTTTTTTTPAP